MHRTLFILVPLVALALVALALGPLLTIWVLNTLFPALLIPYTLETWAAALVLNALIASMRGKK